MSIAVRSERPMSRWISSVRPERFPVEDSRAVLVDVARGIIEYSEGDPALPAVAEKWRNNFFDTRGADHPRLPISIRTDPSAD
jgi:hypothetical protein